MTKTDKIVLNIPHSTLELTKEETSLWSNVDDDFFALVRKWTDCHTDRIFSPVSRLRDKVSSCVFNHSRFAVDVERLVDDPLEKDGMGILYTKYDGYTRDLSSVSDIAKLMCLYYEHRKNLQDMIATSNTLLLDCHSFPNEIAPDVSICIGFNDDESFDQETVDTIVHHFEKHGYHVSLNNPYSNSITPYKGFTYRSVMIELNKRLYMDERNGELLSSWYKISGCINSLYEKLLQ